MSLSVTRQEGVQEELTGKCANTWLRSEEYDLNHDRAVPLTPSSRSGMQDVG